MPDQDIELTHESPATRETAERMARATLGFTFRRTGFRVCVVVMALLLMWLVFGAYDGEGLSTGARLYGSVVWGAVLALAVLLVFCVVGYVTNLRNFRRTVPLGTVQRTGFGREAFVTANALSSSRFSYRAVQSVESHGGFVFIRYVGHPVMRIYPRELFPPDAMTRLREAAAQGSASSHP